MAQRSEIAGVILSAVRSHVAPGTPVSVESPLFEGGLELDSVQFLELILEIEKQARVSLREDDLTPESLASVGSLVAHVERVAPERR